MQEGHYIFFKFKKGSIITDSHLIPKRPGNGLSPTNYKKIVGKTINQDVFEDQLVEIEMFE